MSAQNYISITPINKKGIVYSTDFVMKSMLPAEYTSFVWNFGDGVTSYDSKEAVHTYNYPGIYTVSLTAWTDYGKIYVDETTIDVDYAYRDAIRFEKIPELFNHPGVPNTEPFVISLTSSKINEAISVILQPYNTKSVPHYAVPEKWNFLVPNWRFLDENLNVIKDNVLTIKTEPIYDSSNKQVAVKGTTKFYYVDDLSTDDGSEEPCPLLIIASLSTLHFTYPPESLIYPYASYSNNETVKAIQAWKVSSVIPTSLKVSENYLNDIYPIKWYNVPIPVLITTQYDPTIIDTSIGEWELPVTKAMDYPLTNEIGKLSPLNLTLETTNKFPKIQFKEGEHFIAQKDLYFKNTDEQDNLACGYIFTTITPLSSMKSLVDSNTTFVIQASTIATNSLVEETKFQFPKGYPIRNYIYISHPLASVVNKLILNSYPKYCASAEYYTQKGLVVDESNINVIQTPSLTSSNITGLAVSGVAAVYGIAFNPIKNNLYACDADQNTILRYGSNNTLLTSIQISSITGDLYDTPCHLSIDKKFNVWVSLYDDNRLLKFDYKLNYLLSAGPTDFQGKQLLLSPPVVETDRDDNVWACWSDSVSSVLVKFDTYGRQLTIAKDFPSNSDPISLCITPLNTVWVACNGTNSIMHYDEEGNLIESKNNIQNPCYITIDRGGKIWIAHGYNNCSSYDSSTDSLSTWEFNPYKNADTNNLELSSKLITSQINTNASLSFKRDEVWGGISVDVYDRVWLIDSENNIVAAFRTNYPSYVASTAVIPQITKMPIIKGGQDYVTFVETNRVKSAQASGDWTGNKWYQKYTAIYNKIPIYGTSSPFSLHEIDKDFSLAKVNDTFDMTEYYRSLALPQRLYNSEELFNLIKGVLGGTDPHTEGLGRVVYEKIANYFINHSDIDTAEIPQLASIANSVKQRFKIYNKNFPQQVNKLINLLSIPKNRLRGTKFNEVTQESLGSYVTENTLMTAGNYYVFNEIGTSRYFLYYTDKIDGAEVYPLKSLDEEGLKNPVHLMYNVYELKEYGSYKHNVIDWNSTFTTFNHNLSTDKDWYGDNGVAELLFNNLLTKQLFDNKY